MIVAKDLSHSYEHLLFSDISFELMPKETLSIMGISGSGKSTLLSILSTFLKPKSGKVYLFNKDIYTLSQKEILRIRRFEIGIIFQSHYLFRGFSGYENLKVASILSAQEIDSSLLNLFNINSVIYQNIGTLSGGQQQRVSIARVLTKKPKIIFADEPTGNLDKESASFVIDALFRYVEENSAILIVATHDKELALRCKYSYLLSNKKLTFL